MKILALSFFLLTYAPLSAASPQSNKRDASGRRSDSAFPGGVEVLTPTEGVDFSGYLKELFGKVRKNWYATMPESALLGEKARLVVRFRILPDGKLQERPTVESASGSENLQKVSVVSIEFTSPFRPLPKEFKGPCLEMRFIFLYNLPVSEAKP